MKLNSIRWYRKKHTEKQRIMGIISGGAIFIIAIPFAIVVLSLFIDGKLGLPKFRLDFNWFISWIFIFCGLVLSGWATLSQLKIGKGSPVPIVPTQKLVVSGPYTYCRNPMALGTIIYYLGICIWLGSLSSLMLLGLFLFLFVAYVKLVEEKELEARFGKDYIEYKSTTPFIIPRLRRKKE